MLFARLMHSISRKQARQRQRAFHQRVGRRLLAESLEPRRVLASYVVDTISDVVAADGVTSLREALEAANSNAPVGDAPAGDAGPDVVDNISFAASLGAAVITLGGNQLSISDAIQITRGDAESVTIDANSASRVIEVLDTAGTVTISGLTLTGGVAAGDGGGIANRGANVSLSEMVIDGNSAAGDGAMIAGSGGGIFNPADGNMTIADTTISNNQANRAGGGIEAAAGSTTTLTGVTLDENSTGATPGNGGGLHITGAGVVTISGSTVSNNVAAAEGGGLWNSASGTLTVTDTTIDLNTASGALADQGGGGVFNDGGTLSISGSTISGNEADGALGSGGGLLSVAGEVTVTASTLPFNTANRAGGGIEIIVGDLSLTDTSLISNEAGPAGSAAPGNGGGLHVSGNTAAVSIDGGSVFGNLAALEGGGLWNQSGSTLTVQNGTVISGNTASGPALDDGGGGVFNNGGIVVIDGSTAAVEISGNIAEGTLGSGGGIFNFGGTLTVSGAVLTANEARRAGGGIEVSAGSTTTLSDITLGGADAADGNLADINGGGLHITGAGVVTISGSTVSNNVAAAEGGGLWNSASGTLSVTASSLWANAAPTGGAIFGDGDGGTISITRSTLSGNTASGAGGGVAVEGGTLAINSATITNNQAATGGGVSILAGTSSLINSIIGGNVAGVGTDIAGTLTSDGFNLISSISGATINGLASTDITGRSAGLAALADNGGPTLTHALLPSSAALDAGTAAGQTLDQRGVSRPQGPTFDIGAFESSLAATANDGLISADDLVPGASGDGNPDRFSVVFDVPTQQFIVSVNGTAVQQIGLGSVEMITIEGSSDADTVTIDDASGTGQAMVVTGAGGDDIVTVIRLASSSQLTIDTGDGSDTVQLGDTVNGASGLLGSLTVIGGASGATTRQLRGGNSSISPEGRYTTASVFIEGPTRTVAAGDVLNVIDSSATIGTFFLVDLEQSTLSRQFVTLADFSGIETVSVSAGSGDDVADVRLSSGSPVVVTFDGNAGRDSLAATGSDGDDSVIVQRITTDASPRSPIEVADMECLSIDLLAGNDVAVNDTGGGAPIASSVPALITGRDGDDILVGGNALDVLFGGAGVDALLGGDGNDFLFADQDIDGSLTRAGLELIQGGPGIDRGVGYAASAHAGRDIVSGLETSLTSTAGMQFIFFPRDNFLDPNAQAVEALRQQAIEALLALGCAQPIQSENAVDLGSIDFRLLENLEVVDGQPLQYRFEPDATGFLTIEAIPAANASDKVEIVLVDDQMNFVARGTANGLSERLDVNVTAGQPLQLLVFGDGSDLTLRLNNMVSQNSPLTVHGTDGDDEFELLTDESGLHFVVNGTRYQYAFEQSREINFLGGGGLDAIRLSTQNAADRIIQGSGFASLIGDGYQALVKSIDTIEVVGGDQRPLLQRSGRVLDVNGDGAITSLDALLVINFMSRAKTNSVADLVGELEIPLSQWLSQQSRVDVSGDNQVTALDALRVINELSRMQRGITREAEEAVDKIMASDLSIAAPPTDAAMAALAVQGEDENDRSAGLVF
ncbi:MAG: choice-of-anchor Q domain-containing protein [Planctomycetaceae bacterium]